MRYQVISSKNLEPSKFSTVLTGLARATVTRQVRMRSFMVVKTYGRKQNKKHQGDFPGGPVVKTLHSQCRGPGFNPWSGNQIPHAATKIPHAIS